MAAPYLRLRGASLQLPPGLHPKPPNPVKPHGKEACDLGDTICIGLEDVRLTSFLEDFSEVLIL
jgi:hypothetical protein